MTARVLVPIGLYLAFVPPSSPHLVARGRWLWQGGAGMTAYDVGDLLFHAGWLVVAVGAAVVVVRGWAASVPGGTSEGR